MRKQTTLSLGLTLAVLLLAGWGCSQKTTVTSDTTSQPVYNEQATASIAVANQSLVDSTLTLPKIILGNDGWVVIHADNGGVPGEMIGETALTAGEHKDVKVIVDASKLTPIVHAVLHVDAGTKGTFEYPGADVPVTAKNVAVSGSFKVETTTNTGTKVETKIQIK